MAGIKLLGINKAALEVNAEMCELDNELEKLSDINSNEMDAMGFFEKKKKQREFAEKNVNN